MIMYYLCIYIAFKFNTVIHVSEWVTYIFISWFFNVRRDFDNSPCDFWSFRPPDVISTLNDRPSFINKPTPVGDACTHVNSHIHHMTHVYIKPLDFGNFVTPLFGGPWLLEAPSFGGPSLVCIPNAPSKVTLMNSYHKVFHFLEQFLCSQCLF